MTSLPGNRPSAPWAALASQKLAALLSMSSPCCSEPWRSGSLALSCTTLGFLIGSKAALLYCSCPRFATTSLRSVKVAHSSRPYKLTVFGLIQLCCQMSGDCNRCSGGREATSRAQQELPPDRCNAEWHWFMRMIAILHRCGMVPCDSYKVLQACAAGRTVQALDKLPQHQINCAQKIHLQQYCSPVSSTSRAPHYLLSASL